MQVIRKGIKNPLCVSENEKATLTNPNFLLGFRHKVQNDNVGVVLTNTSSYSRYDLFLFTEGTDAVLKYTGEYVLTIYEQESAVNTDPDNATGVVHVEQCIVLKEPFLTKSNNPTIIRYIHEFS